MQQIHLITPINAPLQDCFDLSRSIDMHLDSMKKTNERAVAGVKSGLIGLGQSVTWKARHFGFTFNMQVRITQMQAPDYFVDEMVKGPFKILKHKHSFQTTGNCTMMRDDFEYASPWGLLGRLADALFLKSYLTHLLKMRNAAIKQSAENKSLKYETV